MIGNQNLEKELNLEEVFNLLKKHIMTIITVTVLAALISWSISYFLITPIYEASTELLVNKLENEQINTYNINDINTDLKLISTYSLIINSPRITDLVIKEYGLRLDSEELVKKISIDTVTDSQVIKITVRDSNQYQAVRIANAIAKVFQREIVTIMNVKNVNILTEAKKLNNPKPIFPNLIFNTLIAFIIGLMLSIILVFLLEYRKNSKKVNKVVNKEVEDYFGYVLLGTLQLTNNSNKQNTFSVSEDLKTIGTNIRFSCSNKLLKSIIVTSVSPQEGKSTIITNLAIVMAQKNKKVILVDTNMRKPSIHKFFGLSNNIGLSNVIVGLNNLNEAIQKTSFENLFVLTSGIIPSNPGRIINSNRMENLFIELYSKYDYLLYDTPPIIYESDTQELTKYVDGVILVVKSGKTNQESEMIIKSRGLPIILKEKMMGIILNTIEGF